jgi:hypothetical protein
MMELDIVDPGYDEIVFPFLCSSIASRSKQAMKDRKE